MTRNQYITWKATRGNDASQWQHADCVAADALIKATTQEAFATFNRAYPKPIADYLNLMARYHFGSAETDHLLTALNMYPDWM